MQVNDAERVAFEQRQIRLGRDFRAIDGGYALDNIHIARQQCGNAGGIARNGAAGHTVPGFGAGPVCGVFR